MSVVERLLTEVRTLSERQAREVMKYIGALKRVNDGEDRLAEEETARQDWAEFERLGGSSLCDNGGLRDAFHRRSA